MASRYEREIPRLCQSDFDWLEEAKFWRNFAWLRPYTVSTRDVLLPAKRAKLTRQRRQQMNDRLAAAARPVTIQRALAQEWKPKPPPITDTSPVAKTQPMTPVAKVPEQRKPPRAERVPPPRIPHSQRNLTPGWPKESTP